MLYCLIVSGQFIGSVLVLDLSMANKAEYDDRDEEQYWNADGTDDDADQLIVQISERVRFCVFDNFFLFCVREKETTFVA